ncbi:MAG: YbhB/YbcL family Raf kinase inhibitor-like protein [Steroidobacteraceae bacterium]|jgi:Raf kinase inhibitor-like YbhB/YbcL family protein
MIGWLPSFIGRALRGRRAGLDKTLYYEPSMQAVPASIAVTSGDFAADSPMPRQHSVDGGGVSPSLAWSGVPAGTASIAVIVEDADSPTPAPFVHLVACGFAGQDGKLATAAASSGAAVGFQHGRNGMMARGWTPPDPPPGHGAHRYVFQVYALDHAPAFGSAPTRNSLAAAIRGHALARGVVVGLYERP